MAIAFVQQKTASQTSSTVLAVTLDAAPTPGNCLVAFVGLGNAAANERFTALPAGWKWPSYPFKNPSKNSVAYWLACFYIIVPKGSGSTFSWTDSGGSISDLHVLEYSGVDVNSPLDTDIEPANQNSSTTPTVIAPALLSTNTMIVGGIYSDLNTATTVATSGVTLRGATISNTTSSMDSFEKLTDSTSNLVLSHSSADYATVGIRLRASGGPNSPNASGNFPPHPPYPRS